MDKQNKSILIYNPYSNIGHFDSWCSIYVKVFVESDWNVVVITKNSKKIIQDIANLKSLLRFKISIFDLNSEFESRETLGLLKKIIFRLKLFKKLDRIKLDSSNYKSPLTKLTIGFLSRVTNFIIRKIETLLSGYLPSRLKINAHNPVEFFQDIELVTQALKNEPSVVLNMYLDLYSNDEEEWKKFADKMRIKWCGIHMDINNTLKDKPYLRSNSLKAIYTINDDQIISSTHQVGVAFEWLPDITDTSLPSEISDLAKDILNFAKGRKIIFLGGAIGGTKNLSMWSKLFDEINHKDWYFVQIGKIDFTTLSIEDVSGLHKLLSATIENIYVSDAYLPDESTFNEIISISSVIWGLYRDFDRSSNILTKAALLSKPIIVSNRYLMGQRVNSYKIGVTVSETNLSDVKNGLDWIEKNPIPSCNYLKYANVYSVNALSKKLNESILRVIS